MCKNIVIATLACMALLSACAPKNSEIPSPIEPTETAIPAPKELTVCLGQEPNTLFLYGNPNNAAKTVFSALYDGPMDYVSYEYIPVILEKIPSFSNGEARLVPVEVRRGDMIVDENGFFRPLDTGVRVRLAGCVGDDCVVAYTGSGAISLDQMVVTFTLLPNLRWSDGENLTAYDSVSAFQLESYWANPERQKLIDRTYSYEVVDDFSTEWWGAPGYLNQDYLNTFWTPLPKHALENIAPGDVPDSEAAARAPLGWGPYILTSWTAGQSIQVERNPNYFRASEGLPRFKKVTFRISSGLDQSISDLLEGKCDILDPSLAPESAVDKLLELQSAGRIKFFSATTNVMERLDLGIQPASFDNGTNSELRPDFFGDRRLRQAIAYCLDRQAVIDNVLFGLSDVPISFLPEEHPLFYALSRQFPFNMEEGKSQLDEIGWLDADGDPATPRTSQGVSRVADQTPLILNYWTTNARQRQQASSILSDSLEKCGIGVNVKYFEPGEFYAAGPQGMLFGRQFDLAQFAMAPVASTQPVCEWYTSEEIPAAENYWIGKNISGFSSQEYDGFCSSAKISTPGSESYYQHYEDAQAVFAENLPSIPLYWRVKVSAVVADLCNFNFDHSALFLWNLETFERGQTCQK